MRTCFEKSTSFGFLPKEGRPSLPSGSFTSGGVAASFGKLHLWRLSEGSARGSRRKQLVSERPSGSFTSGGFLKEA